MRAWALSIDSETPRSADQPKESSVAHANAVVAIVIFPTLVCFTSILPYKPPLAADSDDASEQSEAPCCAGAGRHRGCSLVGAFTLTFGVGFVPLASTTYARSGHRDYRFPDEWVEGRQVQRPL